MSRFFVCYKNNFAGEVIACILQGTQGGQGDAVAAFHIQYAGSVSFAIFNGKGTFGNFAAIEYRINVTHQQGVGFGKIAAFADDGVAAFIKMIPADGEAQFFQNAGAQVTDFHAAFFNADTGIDGYHLFPEINNTFFVCVNPCKCFFFYIHACYPFLCFTFVS